MLHIVNGDSVAEKLKQVAQGEILVWREVYPAGLVFLDPTEAGHRDLRAHYLERELGVPQVDYKRLSAEQEQRLSQFRRHDEVILWFEHDLFDQTMLAYLLHWFAGQELGGTRLSLLCIGSYPGIELFRGLGQLTVEQLEPLVGTWHPVSQAELALGRALWEAYTAPCLEPLIELLQTDTSALPFAHAAYMAHLSRLPSVQNGLGAVEQQTLEALAGGMQRCFQLFDHVGGRLHELGMGDLEYWTCLRRLTSGATPLLVLVGADDFPGYGGMPDNFPASQLRLTETGERVLRGELDYIALAGIDNWHGGVRLQGRQVQWRWDAERRTAVRV